jgi:hypothetical protein
MQNTTWDLDLQKGLMYQPDGRVTNGVKVPHQMWEPERVPYQLVDMMNRLKLPIPSVSSLRAEYPHIWFPDDMETKISSVEDSHQDAGLQPKKGGKGQRGKGFAVEDTRSSPLAFMTESEHTQTGGQKRLRMATEEGEQSSKRTKEHHTPSDAGPATTIFSRPHGVAPPPPYQRTMRAPGGFYPSNIRHRPLSSPGGSLAAMGQVNQPLYGVQQDNQLSRFNSTAPYFHGQAPPILRPSTTPAPYGVFPQGQLPANFPPIGTLYSGAIGASGSPPSHLIQPGLQQSNHQPPLASSQYVHQTNPNSLQLGQNLHTFSSDIPTVDTDFDLFTYPIYEDDEEDDLYSAR